MDDNKTMPKESHSFLPNSNKPKKTNFQLVVRHPNGISKGNNLPSSIQKEYELPIKIIFLLRQINLQQQLINDGKKVTFTFTTSNRNNFGKLIVQTTTESEGYIFDKLLCLMGMIDDCSCLSQRICQYLAKYDEIRDTVNQKLQERNIDAGIAYTNQSISIVAVNADNHSKAIAMLQELLDSQSTNLAIEDLSFYQNIDLFLSLIKKDIPESDSIWLEANLDSQSSTCTLTATGFGKLVSKIIQIINDKQQAFKVIEICIKDACILKTEYLRLYQGNDISALEKKYSCQVKIEAISENEIFNAQLCKPITIKCCQSYKDEIDRQLRNLIDGIIIEMDKSISFYSRIARLFHNSKSKNKLMDYQQEYQCLLIPTDHQGHRYVIYSFD